MGAVDVIDFAVPDFAEEFFPPASTDMVHGMVAEYRRDRQRITSIAALANGADFRAVWSHFVTGNANEDRGRASLSSAVDQAFREAGAVASLNASYWSKALSLTDVYDAMPQARRSQWNEQIRCPEGRKASKHSGETELPPLPDFEEETVRSTLLELLNSRSRFLAERVDGIFRALSGEHVTNSPAAFGKRMIVANLVTGYGTSNSDRVGFINDLRCVIAKFMGRDEPSRHASDSVVDFARRERRGEWVTLDGGAIRLRAYKCGTAHLEVHPDMAWRLNCVLHQLYPAAIPPEFRQKPKRKPKDIPLMKRPLPFAVVEHLAGMESAYLMVKNKGPDAWRNQYLRKPLMNAVQFRHNAPNDSFVVSEVDRVLAYLGGVKISNDRGGHYYSFDYHPSEAIKEVVASGCLPDQKTHQYYPTPAVVAEAAVEMAQIGPEHACIEPSAGTGGLADYMPKDRTLCVEVSALHCKVLEGKGYRVVCRDFLCVSGEIGPFDRIVMNPPFSDGRWQAHLEHAAGMLADGGRLVAVLPASAKRKDLLPGLALEWSRVFDNEFAGTGVSVVILCATR